MEVLRVPLEDATHMPLAEDYRCQLLWFLGECVTAVVCLPFLSIHDNIFFPCSCDYFQILTSDTSMWAFANLCELSLLCWTEDRFDPAAI